MPQPKGAFDKDAARHLQALVKRRSSKQKPSAGMKAHCTQRHIGPDVILRPPAMLPMPRLGDWQCSVDRRALGTRDHR